MSIWIYENKILVCAGCKIISLHFLFCFFSCVQVVKYFKMYGYMDENISFKYALVKSENNLIYSVRSSNDYFKKYCSYSLEIIKIFLIIYLLATYYENNFLYWLVYLKFGEILMKWFFENFTKIDFLSYAWNVFFTFYSNISDGKKSSIFKKKSWNYFTTRTHY